MKIERSIISRICSGELSFSNKTIQDLSNGKLNQENEETLNKLADEIKVTISDNQERRKEISKAIDFAEQDYFMKEELLKIDSDIKELNYTIKKNKKVKALVFAIISALLFGLGIGLSFFTNFSLVPMFAACGLISLGVSSYCNQDEQIGKNKKIKAEIEHLENKRMELLQYDKTDMFESEYEIKKNVVQQVYDEKIEEDELNINL